MSTLYFLAECALIILFAFIFLTVLQLFFFDLSDGFDIILLCVTFFMIIYPATRYVLFGMEHDDVMDEEGYKKTRKKGIIQTFGTGIMFFIFFLLLNIFREGSIDYISIIMVPILFTIFFWYLYNGIFKEIL